MTAASLVGESIVVISLLPVREAVIDIGYVTAALVTTAVILIRSGERQAELIDTLDAAGGDRHAHGTRHPAGAGRGGSIGHLRVAQRRGNVPDPSRHRLFKSINDRYGHPGGDEVLVQLADLLVKSARHDDVVCRIGGDEMALLLPGCSVSASPAPGPSDRGRRSGPTVRALRRPGRDGVGERRPGPRTHRCRGPPHPLREGGPDPVRRQTVGPQPGGDRGRRHHPSHPDRRRGHHDLRRRTTCVAHPADRGSRDGEDDPAGRRPRRGSGGLPADRGPVHRTARRGGGPAAADRRRRVPSPRGGGDPGRGGLGVDRRCRTPRHPGGRPAIVTVASRTRRHPAHRGERVRRRGRAGRASRTTSWRPSSGRACRPRRCGSS